MERAEAEAIYDAGREVCVEFILELAARVRRRGAGACPRAGELCVRFASIEQHITFDPHARERWIAAYDQLSRGAAGLAGAATARAEAHTVRLALLYVLLDCSDVIQLEHLEAALAFWNYSAASARWVFGDSVGDPTADEIWSLARDRHDGITRTEVSNLFSRSKKAREIDRALQALIDAGRLERATVKEPRTGRALTVWRPTGAAHGPALAVA